MEELPKLNDSAETASCASPISSVGGTQGSISEPAVDQTEIQSEPRAAGGGCGCSQHPHPAGDTMSPALPVLFTILLLSAGASGAPSYVVVSPAVLYHPHPATLWVHLSDLQGPVQLCVQLQGDSGTPPTTLLSREVLEPHLHLNVTFPAPAPAKGKEEIVALHVSLQGGSLNVSESKKVLLRALSPGVFIQTDKAVYKPGQEVKFRVVSLDKDLTPSKQKLPLVFLKDPSGNRIAQWRELTPRQGIVDLSLPLASEPALGTYTISVEGKSHSFSVEEYVLPKFEVTIHLPSVLWEQDEKLPVEICGRYTYGKPVQGKVQADLCLSQRLWSPWRQKACTRVMGQTQKNGCFATEVSLAASEEIILTQFLRKKLEVEASLVEDGTGLEMKSTKSCKVLPKRVTVTFENPDHVYKPGLPYSGTIRLQGADGSGLPQRQVLLSVRNQGKERTQSFLTDSSGRASFQLDTSGWSDLVSFQAEVNRTAESQEGSAGFRPRGAFLTARPYVSKSRSFLHIRAPQGELPCGHSQLVRVDSIFGKQALGTELKNLDLVFIVLAKGSITSIFRKEVSAEPGQRASLSLELPIGLELAPMARLLVYVMLPNGEMVADVTELSVAKCLPNQVKMAFSEARALPGAALTLQLGAAPGSLCAVRAVDRSVLLLKPEAELSAEAVYKALPKFNYPHSIEDEPLCNIHWRNSRMEINKLFQDAALKLFTSAKTRERCLPRLPFVGMPGAGGEHSPCAGKSKELVAMFTSADSGIEDGEEPPAPRTYFPETWLWDLVPVGESGSAEVTVTVPDAITEWEAGMFCTAPQGLGLSPAVTLTAFQPFFVELALPYAVVRHETFTLKATVFNYLRQCLRVQVTLAESAELEVSLSAGDTYRGCICADEAKTFQWGVRATSLGEVNITVSTEALSSSEPCGNELPLVPAQGRMDTVIKPLLVQPGGILVEKTHSSLLCQEGDEEVSLEIPENILESSQRAHIAVMGDILGNALQNLDRLLAMPYGCGEQNMVHFAPNIYIQQYLEKTGQLLPDIRAKAQGFLQSGYQRELLYKHDDGSYSAFGKSDSTGNTWLTAFVLKSFGQARAYVAIEERHITDALRWLQQHQKKSGCFHSVGKLFNNALQGGVSDELSLSAYVTAAMLELGLPTLEPVVSSALKCLEASPTDNPYTQALLAYVFGLAGLGEQQQAQLQRLAQHSVSADGQLYWKRKGQAQKALELSWAAAAPAEVEMTAYVLLAYLSQPSVSPADLGVASQIVRWLCKQQNPYGGFASTQDTVVALQALAKYAVLTYGSNGDITVTVTSPTGTVQDFVLDSSNRLVLQRAALPELPGTYGLQARGQGCALLQVTLRYNVPPPPSTGAFELQVETEPLPGTPNPQFLLRLWARYSGERPATNMVVIEAKLPSGYSPDKKSVVELKRQNVVKKVEVQPDQVTIYLDQLSKQEETFSFRAQQDFLVSNLQPATVSLYDYYETGDRVDVAYTAPPSSENENV
ncbi:LOW QUALITY PROTEIN: alpha-2-macroglobulin-like protein 1 [Pyrgilauda ruficollis]|uniref:LOW QUALITY PROTEIN: alpha-2-macroglobulin-like protein 1 n=1 Tax=Pyrgilauda ruficollis TaxID=221976 RepID=UPI001B8625A5|nr:LOW QUALITY PROTEIN: alpha-2-macroglobulin-like protein 1 [Pyrgilauda ruficollis]